MLFRSWVYNKIMVPILNAMINMFTSVYNVFIAVWNGIVMCLNAIQIPTDAYWDWGLHITWGSLGSMMGISKGTYANASDYTATEISTDYTSSSNGDNDSSTSSGASASYTATGDTYVNIYYNNSYVNGDAEEIALQIRNDILSAERKGK